ncbi:hypothetical protein L1987_63853 [Smallanthus sonchifolius]|uniref:Uncharacterized protein n=1 Tax=Smallanthus sonchifolius TaxID=185202 RepID=A0ACB9CE99_9ASTR|nr:hypothetical protein L1987_63853 [Smallanthus sonchifolius]
MSAISIINNPVEHSKTKHIDIRYHFIRDQAEKKRIILTKVHTNEQYADLFTKPFDEARFRYLVESIVKSEQGCTVQGIPQIQAKVDDKDITITEATFRKHLKLQDEGAAISYSREEYMRTFVSIGYTGNQNEYTIERALISPQWKFLCHTLLQCISQKRSGWHQVSSALASAVHGMVSVQGFNFAHLIFKSLRYNLQEGAKQSFFMYPRFLQEFFNNELKDLSKPARIYLMLGHKNNIFQSMRTVSKKFSGVNVPLLSTMMNIQSSQGDSSAIPTDTDPTPSTSKPEQQTASTVRTPVHTTKDAHAKKLLTPVLDVITNQLEHTAPVAAKYTRKRSKKTPSILVSQAQSQPKSPHSESQHSNENIKMDSQTLERLPWNVEAPSQDDIPSLTTTILEVLIDLATNVPNPSSSPKKVHSGSVDRVNVESAVTTPGTSIDQEDSDNIAKTLTTETHKARPKAPSCSKDSTTVDEDTLKLHNLELTARVGMLEAENESQNEDTPSSFSILPAATAISRQTINPQSTPTENKLEFYSILAWGYDGLSERFWIGKEFGGVEELNWNTLNPLQVLEMYLSSCSNTSTDLSTELAIDRVAYPEHHAESSTTSEQRLAPRLDLIRSSVLTEEEVLCWRRFLYNEVARGLEVQGWSSTGSSGFKFFLSDGSSFTINNIQEILLLKPDFLNKTAAVESRKVVAQNVKEAFKVIHGSEWEKEESEAVPSSVSIPQLANEAKVEILIASLTSDVVIHEAEAEASNKNKGKGIITEEEQRLQQEKKEREKRRREREEEEMTEFRKIQERKAVILLREQQIQLHARQQDALKVQIPAAAQLQEDEALALQLQEQLNKEEEEREKKRKEEAKLRINDSELAKEMREEWIEALISQGEDADYREKLSNKEIYRAFMGQQGQLAKKKRAEKEEKAKQKSKKTIAFNIRTHEERKVMIDFLKVRGESGKRLGPMSFMNLQALYFKVKKEEIMKLGEAHEPENEGGRHLLLVIKHHFNPSKDVIFDAKPLKSHSPFFSWSYNAAQDEYTLIDVRGQKMRCSSKAIFSMPSKDIKTFSELLLDNPSKDPRGYELWIVESCCGSSTMLLIAISDEDQSLLLTGIAKATLPLTTFCCNSDTPHEERMLLVQTIKDNNALLPSIQAMMPKKTFE